MMRGSIDVNLWLQRLLYWLLLSWYGLSIVALVALMASWPSRPLTSFVQIPWWSLVLALALIAATYTTVSAYLSQGVHHLIYGQHDDAFEVVERVHEHLRADTSADSLLPTLAATLSDTLKLPYVAIRTMQDGSAPPDGRPHTTTTYGTMPPHAELTTIPLRYQDRTLGTLRVSSRRSRDRLSNADLRLLDTLASQVGITLYAAQLTEALQTSRAQLVTAREEERRRIRRDLHDGLGPTLASLRMQLSAARRLVRDTPDEAEQLIDELRDDVSHATADIRRLVYELRPPMLDELGLVVAIRNFKLSGSPTQLDVVAPEPMPRLSAAVEVAVYRIASEAIHNVIKHAGATTCVVEISVGAGQLTLSVTDDGHYMPAGHTSGMGLRSMRERAAELGGTFSVQPTNADGTCILVQLPLELR